MKQFLKHRILFIFCLFVAFVPNRIFAINITAQVDSNNVLIGKQVNFSILLTQRYGENVQFPVYADTVIDKVEVLRSEFSDTIPIDENTFEIQQHLLITSFDTGAYMLPVGPFIVKNNGTEDTVYGNPVFFGVETVSVDTTQPFIDIKPPLEAPFEFAELYPILKIVMWVAIALAVLGVIIYFLYKYLNRDKDIKEKVEVEEPKIPPHEVAYRELEILKNEQIWQKKEFKLYYSRLTDILRVYIEDKFKVLALESTTDEIIRDLKAGNVIDFASIEILEQILQIADLTKFAKAEPDDKQNMQSFSLAYDFISRTKMLVAQSSDHLTNDDSVSGDEIEVGTNKE